MDSSLHTYIIAEVGQNHNGEMQMAKQLIDMTAMPIMDKAFNRNLVGVDAIKFTKRDMSEELTTSAYKEPYLSEHSFGKTYGEHREKLELSYENHVELYHYAKSKNLDFIDTLTSIKTLKLLNYITPDYIKVASRDLTHIPLLQEIAQTGIPVILSTGMGGLAEIEQAVEIIAKHHEKIIILHCISQYPADYINLNLRSIPLLKERFPYPIGYSDHSIGIVAPVVAVALGASYIEKHITLNHALKGSDHKGALEPDGLWRVVRDIRNVEMSLGEMKKEMSESVKTFKTKLERSLAVRRDVNKGEILSEGDLIMLSPGGGLKWQDRQNILGKKAKMNIGKNTSIKLDMFD